MMKVFSAKQTKLMDQATCSTQGMLSFDLMNHASQACAQALFTNNLILIDQTIVIVCGVGNNGGDGLMIGRALSRQNYNVQIMMIDRQSSFTEEVQQAISIVQDEKMIIHWITSSDERVVSTISQADVIIDALLGIGANRLCDEKYIGLIEAMNHSQAEKISVDIPSGLNATSGFAQPIAVKADHTLVIGALKQGHVLFDGWDTCGRLHMVDIGLNNPTFASPFFIENASLAVSLPLRKRNVHKYNFGHVLVVGGSQSMMGSVSLTCLAALRSGAGLVSLAMQPLNHPYARGLALEIMTPEYRDQPSFESLMLKKTSVVYGMGLSKERQPEYVIATLLKSEVPLVIDADGLVFFIPYLEEKRSNDVLVLTPHLMELSRLTNLSMEQIKKDPVQIVQDLANKAQAIVLLKGPSTILSNGTRTEIIEVGNSGLATAGTGDVLAGVIGTFIGQNKDGFEAVKQAVTLFDKAAQLAKENYSEPGMIASDVVCFLPKAFKQT